MPSSGCLWFYMENGWRIAFTYLPSRLLFEKYVSGSFGLIIFFWLVKAEFSSSFLARLAKNERRLKFQSTFTTLINLKWLKNNHKVIRTTIVEIVRNLVEQRNQSNFNPQNFRRFLKTKKNFKVLFSEFIRFTSFEMSIKIAWRWMAIVWYLHHIEA